jgi:hypothetical protein
MLNYMVHILTAVIQGVKWFFLVPALSFRPENWGDTIGEKNVGGMHGLGCEADHFPPSDV